ncbi:tyrosinase family protein [Aquabacterium humicola]|uniref:tyrosinase family protein n=1 Tax=Aquabacterium humicola TaxID=3237377 RepID=UPI00254398E4|nr:tyrosinase family protein [Rubrivivax pictus]
MGVRKNAKFLTDVEREAFVRACVMLKAEIINPGAPSAQQYSRWDQLVAEHQMIQNAFAPGAGSVNFGHGGSGAFSFLSWHRYFLLVFERDLQRHVPGVMLPYWDWQDPAPIMTDTFLGPNNGAGGVVRRGYFAIDAPGTGTNPTAAPLWWPAGLVGWRLPAAFGSIWQGGLRRSTGALSNLPTLGQIAQALAKTNYRDHQLALESGSGISPLNQMHNGMHGWIGGNNGGTLGHMSHPDASPFDPIFYLHHCNIDRLWAMWQLDGHATEYPSTGGRSQHHRNDLMYPWVGTTAGYGTNVTVGNIAMPDYSALGAQRNVDTLDHRALGYTYDTMPIVGIALDRTGSMNGLTPDPMTSGAADVSKWEAAKRGVAAFLQDAENARASGEAYVTAGVKTFRSLAGNLFEAVFAAPGYGLVKTGTQISASGFTTAMTGLGAAGGTPLADALLDINTTLVDAPAGGVPADEQRYLALLTDGMLTSGAPLSSIPNGSLARTAVFGMGFGTGAEVDYATIASLVAKGRTLTTQQVFHGENAGTIDKFFGGALAAAIGYSPVTDPVLEMFAGEFSHVDFSATSADDGFLITAQGMDFDSANWRFQLHGPGGVLLYGDHEGGHDHDGCDHCCPSPQVTASVSEGRLSLIVRRGNAPAHCWVGGWQLMVAYKARRFDGMVMPQIADWLYPVAAGPARGARWSRLLVAPDKRVARRNVVRRSRHALDAQPLSSNRSGADACDVVVNIYARTRLRLSLVPDKVLAGVGGDLNFELVDLSLGGVATVHHSAARLVSPSVDLAALFGGMKPSSLPREQKLDAADGLPFDPARVLATLEKRSRTLGASKDQVANLVQHHGGPWHVHAKGLGVPGVVHLGVWLSGTYDPLGTAAAGGHGGGHSTGQGGAVHGPGGGEGEPFSRVFSVSAAVLAQGTPPKAAGASRSTGKRKD